ncbi:uncharacterized protein [Nicotiana tomentosiformis]|uniref:uncharacterized protein n=1 Tax=Nicotiana tomentosiformis TaxID=4098 RepID=UPI00388C526F
MASERYCYLAHGRKTIKNTVTIISLNFILFSLGHFSTSSAQLCRVTIVTRYTSVISTVADDRPTQDVDSRRRLSYGSSSRDAGDLSQAQASSSPVTEATLCDTDLAAPDDYIQEPDETMVTAGQTTPSTEPASPTDDHAAAHPPIKRRRDEDDPDSVAGRDGMRLRPTASLKHT